MLCIKCGKLFYHSYKAYCCSEHKVRAPLTIYSYLDHKSFFLANCVVLAIDAPLPYGDKTELTKQLVRTHQGFIEKRRTSIALLLTFKCP